MRRNPPLSVLSTCLLLLGASACVSAGSIDEPASRAAFEPAGPGAVFPDIESAVVDALAQAHMDGLSSHRPGLARGGTITRVEGGFGYGQLVIAHPDEPHRVDIVLGTRDVASFRTYPRVPQARTNGANRRHTAWDKRNVDEVDPGKRPSFILTPALGVRAYLGRDWPTGQPELDLGHLAALHAR